MTCPTTTALQTPMLRVLRTVALPMAFKVRVEAEELVVVVVAHAVVPGGPFSRPNVRFCRMAPVV